jgi:hypothetical protein
MRSAEAQASANDKGLADADDEMLIPTILLSLSTGRRLAPLPNGDFL